jgi:hypothetical protein
MNATNQHLASNRPHHAVLIQVLVPLAVASRGQTCEFASHSVLQVQKYTHTRGRFYEIYTHAHVHTYTDTDTYTLHRCSRTSWQSTSHVEMDKVDYCNCLSPM